MAASDTLVWSRFSTEASETPVADTSSATPFTRVDLEKFLVSFSLVLAALETTLMLTARSWSACMERSVVPGAAGDSVVVPSSMIGISLPSESRADTFFFFFFTDKSGDFFNFLTDVVSFISVSSLCASPASLKAIKVLLAIAGMSEFLMVLERHKALLLILLVLTDEEELTLVLLLLIMLRVITVLVLLLE